MSGDLAIDNLAYTSFSSSGAAVNFTTGITTVPTIYPTFSGPSTSLETIPATTPI
ncbi:unnamed protein product [Candida parapsilosis]